MNSTVDAVDAAPGNGACETIAGECTLRAAIQEANALPGADTIDLPAGTYRFSVGCCDQDGAGGDLDIHDDVAIAGAGAASTIIDADYRDGVVEIRPAAGGGEHEVEIARVTIRRGLRQAAS